MPFYGAQKGSLGITRCLLRPVLTKDAERLAGDGAMSQEKPGALGEKLRSLRKQLRDEWIKMIKHILKLKFCFFWVVTDIETVSDMRDIVFLWAVNSSFWFHRQRACHWRSVRVDAQGLIQWGEVTEGELLAIHRGSIEEGMAGSCCDV